jgi:hypothetical protein
MAAATSSTDGYLTSTDWTTFNSKGSGSVTSVAATVPSFLSVTGSPITTSGTLALAYSGTALPVVNGGTGVTTSTGTGSVVLSTSPSLTTPTQVTYENWTPISEPSYTEGRVWYDSNAHALAYFNDAPNSVAHVGHELQVKVINNTGSSIPNGSPVYITSTSSGQTYPNIALARADVAATASVIGLTNGAIANGAFGYVVSTGTIDDVNTGSYTVGQVLYLSPYSAGQLMNTLPPTGLAVQVGVVEYVNSSTGKIYVKQTTPLSIPASIISGAVAIANGGTGQTTQAAAITALAGTQASGQYLRSNGTNTLLSAIQAADVPTLNQNTTGTAANITATSNSTLTTLSALSLPGSQVSGNISGNASNVTGIVAIANGGTNSSTAAGALTNLGAYPASNPAGYGTGSVTSVAASVPAFLSVSGSPITTSGTLAISYSGTALPIANGGSGATTAQTAMNAFAGAVTSGSYLRGNGTNVVMATIQAADVPTLNQNTTGTAANVTGLVAVANGGTGTATPSIVAGTNITVSGTWPNQTINAAGGGGSGTVTSVAASVPSFLSVAGSPITTSGTLAISYSGTALPVANGGTGLTSFTANQVHYGSFSQSANLTFDGTTLTAAGLSGPHNGTVGATTANTGSFTSLAYSTTLTGGTGIVNLGSGQFYKDASGNVGIGTSSPVRQLTVSFAGSPEFVLQDTTQAANSRNWRMFTTANTLVLGTLNDAGSSGNNYFQLGSAGQWGIGSNYGTSGQVLTSGGSGAAPSWTTVSGGGGITTGKSIAMAMIFGF